MMGAELRVGYSASVIIEVEKAENVLKVPVEAVVRQGTVPSLRFSVMEKSARGGCYRPD